MKRFALILAFLLAAYSAQAAIAFSNSGVNSGNNVTSVVTTVTINANDTVLVIVGIDSGAQGITINSVTDTATNTYSQLAFLNNVNSGNTQIFIWGVTGGVAAATSVTVSPSTANTGTNVDVTVLTYTGVGGNGFGTTHTASGSSTTPTDSLTTQDANNFVVMGAVQHATASITWSANTGNLRNSVQSTGGSKDTRSGGNDNTAATASAVTNKITSNRSSVWAVASVELRSTSAGGPACANYIALMGAGCK